MELSLKLDERLDTLVFAGQQDQNLRRIEESLSVQIFLRANTLTIQGKSKESVENAKAVIDELHQMALKKDFIDLDELRILVEQAVQKKSLDKNLPTALKVSSTGKFIRLRTFRQQKYVDKILKNDITFGLGPAGTGKTYIAVAVALNHLIEGKVKKVILTRPVVEAGESLGFLPGSLEDKVNPYLKPLLDSIFDMLSAEEIAKYRERGQIEVAPLAYMRGRTLNNAFIILDESQNTLISQMKMFLTRLGLHSKVVVTGDITQKDLPGKNKSGLEATSEILKGIHGIDFINFIKEDVVRHPIVIKIIEAFEKNEL